MMLADLGADVAKIEEFDRGDELRWVGRYEGRGTADEDYFYASNRSKRSIALNLKNANDRAIAHALVQQAHVVIENFAPGVADRLRMGWGALRQLNPRLVYCSISGFGQSGPYRDRLALDPIIQAVSGVMSVTGESDGAPMQIGAPIADVVAGMFGAFAILGALYSTRENGIGRYIDISMQDAMLAVLGPRMGESLQAGRNPGRHGNGNPMRVPANTYQTKDGKYIAVIVQNDKHWAPFCRALGCEHWLLEARFASMASRVEFRAELDHLVADQFAKRLASEWAVRFAENRVPFSMVKNYLEALADEQVAHRGLIREVIHPVSGAIRVVGPPWIMSDEEAAPFAPPLLGQHTDELLGEWLGWSHTEISNYKQSRKLQTTT
jgi:formyl-CoA transferase/CoA:oxalate CoA-transferase